MRDWILEYRTDFLELRKKNKEVFEFIKNHDDNRDKIMENRDVRISTILSQDYIDPLNYLNPIINIIESNIKRTMKLPVSLFHYRDDDTSYVIAPKTKQITAETRQFSDINKFSDFISDEYYIFPYLISMNEKGNLTFRGTRIKKEKNIKWY